MEQQHLLILEMLDQGEITVLEAVELIQALDTNVIQLEISDDWRSPKTKHRRSEFCLN